MNAAVQIAAAPNRTVTTISTALTTPDVFDAPRRISRQERRIRRRIKMHTRPVSLCKLDRSEGHRARRAMCDHLDGGL